MASDQNIVRIKSSYSELKEIRDFIQYSALSCGFSEEDAYKLTTAVDEICTNLIKHAFKQNDTHEITVSTSLVGDEFVISITDDAAPFDMDRVADKNMDEYFGKFTRGGLGVQLVRKIMDKISYKAASNGNTLNVLTLSKKLHSDLIP